MISLAAALPASAQLVSAPVSTEPPTPDLIDRAEERGDIDLERASLYRLYALSGDQRLPRAYRSNSPWRGTLLQLKLRRDAPQLDPGPERTAVAAALRAPPDPNPSTCFTYASLPNSIETAHFYIQFAEGTFGGGLDEQDYADSLEEAYAVQVTQFGWAGPPQTATGQAAIPGKYHVLVQPLGPGLYGLVSNTGTYAGSVGNNPNTAWSDGDAQASCMVLNSDFETGFPGTAQQALDATTAHEYNHSIQYGYGALNGSNVPDDNFVEGGATWMEDEVFDAADDNYNYLYPEFDDSMGEYDEGDIYAYWFTWRGLTERFGTNLAGGGEDVMQRFWELTSQNAASNLTAMQQALTPEGTTLADAYHDFAIAAKFLAPCAGGYVLPYCFEEAAGYVAAAGETAPHGEVATGGGSYSGSIEDNYALNWVVLPDAGPYDVTLTNTSAGGRLRATVACDTGAEITRVALPEVVGGGAQSTAPGFDPSGCEQVVAAITNQSQTAANPSSSAARAYTLSTSLPPVTPGAPNTTITSGPPDVTSSDSATFQFTSTDDDPEFECRLDSTAESDFQSCTSPHTRSGLANGPHTFDVRSIDPDSGLTDPTPARRTFTVQKPAAGSATGGTTTPPATNTVIPDTVRPLLTRLALSSRRFRAARSGRAIASSPLGTRVRYRLSEAATTSVRYERKTIGRRVGGRCRVTTRSNARRAKCVRWVVVRGTARHRGRPGSNRLRLSGRMNGKALKPGVYRLRMSARDSAGNTSKLRRSAWFRIVRR